MSDATKERVADLRETVARKMFRHKTKRTQTCWEGLEHDVRQHWLAMADAAIAAMPGPRVKPLVWKDAGFEQDADFVDTTQTYQVQEGIFWYGAEVYGHVCGSNEDAKAAAQADYERRILAALEGGDA